MEHTNWADAVNVVQFLFPLNIRGVNDIRAEARSAAHTTVQSAQETGVEKHLS